MIDLGSLKAVPGIEIAIEAHAAAERAVAADPAIAEGDPSAFVAIFTLLAWARAGGDNAALVTELERAAARAPEDRDHRGEDA